MVEFMCRSTKIPAWIFTLVGQVLCLLPLLIDRVAVWLVDHAFIHWQLKIIVIVTQVFSLWWNSEG